MSIETNNAKLPSENLELLIWTDGIFDLDLARFSIWVRQDSRLRFGKISDLELTSFLTWNHQDSWLVTTKIINKESPRILT